MADKEIWRQVPNFNYIHYYVSNLGNVKNDKGYIMKPNYNKHTGYCQIALCYAPRKYKHFNLHRLVAELFVPNPHSYNEVNHKNEIRTDNRADNLEWCTHKYNSNYGNHKARISESQRNHGNSKSIPIIITLPNGKTEYAHSLREAAEITGWNRSTIARRLKNPGATFDKRAVFHFEYATNKQLRNHVIEQYTPEELDRRHQRTYQSVVNELKGTHPDIILLSGYQGVNKPARFRCLRCQHEFTKTPKAVLTQRVGCDYCARQHMGQLKAKSRAAAEADIKRYLYDNLIIGDDYENASTAATFTCKRCGAVFQGKLTQLIHNAKMHGFVSCGCQHCGKKRTATISNMKRAGRSDEEIQRVLAQKHLDWCPYNA